MAEWTGTIRRRCALAAGGFLLVAAAANLLSPALPPAAGLPTASGRAAALAQTLRPEWVLLAGSERYIGGIDTVALAAGCGRTVAAVTAERAGPAWMYLFVKNIAPRRSVVVLPFSGAQLTIASLYADSGRTELAHLMLGRDPEVERLSYCNGMPRTEYWLRRCLPLYAWRPAAAKRAQTLLEQDAVYAQADAARRQQQQKGTSPAATSQEEQMWDFPEQNRDGYLEQIIQMAREKDIRLVFLRMPGPADRLAEAYHAQLNAYLQAQRIDLLDALSNGGTEAQPARAAQQTLAAFLLQRLLPSISAQPTR